jgi:hypothetical protein
MELATISNFSSVVWACIGGMVVAVGIVLEIFSEKDSFKSVASLRRWKTFKSIGEWIVVGGIVIEVIDGGFTARDIWRNDPRKRAISSMTATVKLSLHNADVLPYNPMNSAELSFGKSSETRSNNWKVRLVIKSSIGANNKILQFGMPDELPRWNLSDNDTVESADTWDAVSLMALFIPKGAEVDGEATVFFNNEMKKYLIPLQRAHFTSNPTGIKDSSGAIGIEVTPNPF